MLNYKLLKIASWTFSCDVTSLVGVKIWPSWGVVGKISKSPSRRGLQWNHAQLQNQVASRWWDILKSCFKFAQNRKKKYSKLPSRRGLQNASFRISNHTLGKAFEFQPQIDQKNGTSKNDFKTGLGAFNQKIWAF